MPYNDHTGPEGMGPRTGRGRGMCGKSGMKGNMEQIDAGMRRGLRHGACQGQNMPGMDAAQEPACDLAQARGQARGQGQPGQARGQGQPGQVRGKGRGQGRGMRHGACQGQNMPASATNGPTRN